MPSSRVNPPAVPSTEPQALEHRVSFYGWCVETTCTIDSVGSVADVRAESRIRAWVRQLPVRAPPCGREHRCCQLDFDRTCRDVRLADETRAPPERTSQESRMTAPDVPDELWPAFLAQTLVTARSNDATVVSIDHRIREPGVGPNIGARWRVRTPESAPILPSAFDPAVARSARTVARARGRVILLADIASARAVAALTYHLDADPRRAVQLLALGATNAIPAPGPSPAAGSSSSTPTPSVSSPAEVRGTWSSTLRTSSTCSISCMLSASPLPPAACSGATARVACSSASHRHRSRRSLRFLDVRVAADAGDGHDRNRPRDSRAVDTFDLAIPARG
jgi:hypothetical protein